MGGLDWWVEGWVMTREVSKSDGVGGWPQTRKGGAGERGRVVQACWLEAVGWSVHRVGCVGWVKWCGGRVGA